MPFLPEKRQILVMTPVRDQILIQNGSPMIAGILFSCQRAAIVGRYKQSLPLRLLQIWAARYENPGYNKDTGVAWVATG
jgi:hypothetical protein